MHIKFSDQHMAGHEVEVCIDRRTQSARVLSWCCPEHLAKIVEVVKPLNVSVLEVTVLGGMAGDQAQALQQFGWEPSHAVILEMNFNADPKRR